MSPASGEISWIARCNPGHSCARCVIEFASVCARIPVWAKRRLHSCEVVIHDALTRVPITLLLTNQTTKMAGFQLVILIARCANATLHRCDAFDYQFVMAIIATSDIFRFASLIAAPTREGIWSGQDSQDDRCNWVRTSKRGNLWGILLSSLRSIRLRGLRPEAHRSSMRVLLSKKAHWRFSRSQDRSSGSMFRRAMVSSFLTTAFKMFFCMSHA